MTAIQLSTVALAKWQRVLNLLKTDTLLGGNSWKERKKKLKRTMLDANNLSVSAKLDHITEKNSIFVEEEERGQENSWAEVLC